MPERAVPLLTDSVLANAIQNASLAARIVIDRNPRARRISLRLDPGKGCIVLVRPRRASDAFVASFLASRTDWIAKHLDMLPPHIPFADGTAIPYRGTDHILRMRPQARGGVWREGNDIVVTGRPEHAPRRTRDWLKREALQTLTVTAQNLAAQLGVTVTRISVRDTRSRWGSCTRDGKLSFSWRLILAPADVLTYVAAHEVAHLKHMNHSPRFWDVVEELLQTAGIDWVSAREWLRRSGAGLHRYG